MHDTAQFIAARRLKRNPLSNGTHAVSRNNDPSENMTNITATPPAPPPSPLYRYPKISKLEQTWLIRQRERERETPINRESDRAVAEYARLR